MSRSAAWVLIPLLASVLALGVLVASCGSTADGRATARVTADRAFANCPLEQRDAGAVLHVLDSAADWSAQVSQGEAQALGHAVDWRHSRVLIAGMGRAPSGGWSVALDHHELTVQLGEVTVPLRRVAPPAGALVTQALTTPCLFIVLPRAHWQRVNPVWRE